MLKTFWECFTLPATGLSWGIYEMASSKICGVDGRGRNSFLWFSRTGVFATLLLSALLAFAQQAAPAEQTVVTRLTIMDETLPPVTAGSGVHVPLHATGGVPPYRWAALPGDLPSGISLTPEGILAGCPTQSGDFAITVTVTDSGQPAHTISKSIRVQVTAVLLLEWLRPPQAGGNRIDGVAQVSNAAKEDFDLTVIIVAVNAIGRATALGYQHLRLKAGSGNLNIPFGTTLPRGAYVVHADAVAEIPARNTILRQRLQTPALPVNQGP
jgi:hypothetical protein